jgi:deaminated glutathione amidase
MKVAILQLRAGSNKTENVLKALDFTRRAISQKAEFIVLPETFSFNGKIASGSMRKKIFEDIPGASLLPLMEVAQKHRVWILAGSIYERIPSSEKAYNTSALIDAKGKVSAIYRKNHLFKTVIRGKTIDETRHFQEGKQKTIATIQSIKVGLSICYDLRFPELYREYYRKGVKILCIPSAFTYATGKKDWEVLLRVRAIENRCYVLAPNQIGYNPAGVLLYGHSMIVSPDGTVMKEASGNKEEILYGNIGV